MRTLTIPFYPIITLWLPPHPITPSQYILLHHSLITTSPPHHYLTLPLIPSLHHITLPHSITPSHYHPTTHSITLPGALLHQYLTFPPPHHSFTLPLTPPHSIITHSLTIPLCTITTSRYLISPYTPSKYHTSHHHSLTVAARLLVHNIIRKCFHRLNSILSATSLTTSLYFSLLSTL